MANTLFIGKVYHRFDQLPSTNDHAAELIAKSTPPEGTVIRAASQTAGRGQFGSRWESAAGKNLTLSVILYPDWLEAGAQFHLSMATALALHDTVYSIVQNLPDESLLKAGEPSTVYRLPSTVHRPPSTVKIKWPNDLYLGDRKAAGILIQNSLSGAHLQSSILGIGLNVNQTEFDPSLPNPGSLASAYGRLFDLETVADTLLEYLERRYLQLKAGQRQEIRADYEDRLYRLDTPAQFARKDGSVFAGTVRGVGTDGRLRVEKESGETDIFDLKEIRFLQ
ncbi:MAG: biotin--[acetyl-CoA-carboxylase] ligase [Lewinellaceae bacterium]|nr:biotin--[acetyl-CoA-carboxylase] ligase [Lewinellaceae bacterium]